MVAKIYHLARQFDAKAGGRIDDAARSQVAWCGACSYSLIWPRQIRGFTAHTPARPPNQLTLWKNGWECGLVRLFPFKDFGRAAT